MKNVDLWFDEIYARNKKNKIKFVSLKHCTFCSKKLSLEERQLRRLQLFTHDAFAEMKAFEAALKKKTADK